MAKKKMKAQTVARAISAKELKFWLEGILEFQDENWIPNGEQWKSIQEKIFNLQETPEVVHVSNPQQQHRAPAQPQVENVFLPNGGVAGQPASTFPDGSEANPLPPIGVSSIPVVPQGPMPVRDANGFYRMPNEIGGGEVPVVSSVAKVHKLKNNGFD